jgi:hypothetical protein
MKLVEEMSRRQTSIFCSKDVERSNFEPQIPCSSGTNLAASVMLIFLQEADSMENTASAMKEKNQSIFSQMFSIIRIEYDFNVLDFFG